MQNKIIISIISFVVFLILACSTLYLSLAVLKPSIEKGEGFQTTSCLVTGTNSEATCDNAQCVDQNDDIWWYDSWGPSYFFVYVSNGNGGSDYSDDDGGDDDGGNDDDDNDDGNGDTGDDDGNSGGESGGDSGGDSGGGDSGGGGGDDLLKGKYYMESLSVATTGSAQFGGYVPQEIKHKKLARKLAAAKAIQQGSSSEYPTQTPNPTATTTTTPVPMTTGPAPMTSGSSNYDSSASGCNTCYQGIFYVTYTDSYGDSLNSTIQGLVSADSTWVSGYLANYVNGSYYTCYYNEDSTEQVIWFEPPKYNTASLVGTIILSIVSLIFLVLSIVLCALGMHHSKNQSHHHHRHSNGSAKYKPITATAAPISAKKGFQSYHKTNGSSHGGYDQTPPPYGAATTTTTTANVPYYQYNQGIAQIDFSNNNNGANMNYGSINNINKPPQYGI